MSVIDSLFDVSWEALDRVHLEGFLREAGDEGLTWEVKGDANRGEWPRREQIEKAVCGFANSRLGGVLIIGAERDSKNGPGWTLTGLAPPKERETELAISRVIRSGVQPPPWFRVKVWPIDDGRMAAAVWVHPVDRPPSITRDGRVFERTTGETEPVRDPTVLSRLFAAGEQATQRAEDKAMRVARRSISSAPSYGDAFNWNSASSQQGRVGVGVAATSYGSDIGGRLFRNSFAETMERLARAQLVCMRAIGLDRPDLFWRTQQRDSIAARLDPGVAFSHVRRFALVACWDGSVGVACLEQEGASLDLIREDVLESSLNVACRLALSLGGSGQLHLALSGDGPMHHQRQWPHPKRPVRRWLNLRGDEDPESFEVPSNDLDYVMDELYRSSGEERWIDDA